MNGSSQRGANRNDVEGIISFNPPLENITKFVAVTRIYGANNTFKLNGNVVLTNQPTQNDQTELVVYEGAPITISEYSQYINQTSTFYGSDDFRTLKVALGDDPTLIEVDCTNIQTPIDGDAYKATGDFSYDPGTVGLTFDFPNSDLQYFKQGDEVQGDVIRASTYTVNTLPEDWNGESTKVYIFGSDGAKAEDVPVGDPAPVITGGQTQLYEFDTASRINFVVPVGASNSTGDWFSSDDGENWTFVETMPNPPGNVAPANYTYSPNVAAKYLAVSRKAGSYSAHTWYPGDSTGDTVKVVSVDVIDNELVVDGGNWLGSDGSSSGTATAGWNQDQTWSSATRTGDGTDASGKSVATVFNGVTNVSAGNWYIDTGSPAKTSTITFSTPIPYTKVELQAYANTSSDAEAKLFANGVDVTNAVGNRSDQWQEKFDITSLLSGGTLNSVGVGAGSKNAGVLYSVYVDGRLLVDTGIPGAPTPSGDTKVEYQTNGGKGTVIAVDTSDNTIKVVTSSNRDDRWIAENNDGIAFAVAGPTTLDKPLLTADVELQSSSFATTPEGVDGLKEIIWNLNGVDQPGTLLNPYKPTGLTTNTTYSVKVKHVAQRIGESDWSTTTTFSTGASRSLKEHYVRQIFELREALDKAEAKPKRGRRSQS